MPNVHTPMKVDLRRNLHRFAMEALENGGWQVANTVGGGRTHVRRITKNGESKLAAIRTSQDTWIAFMRNKDNTKWTTLSDVDVVVVASVDRHPDPEFALIHMIDANDMRDRFERAYSARRDAGHSLPEGRGIWVSLYRRENTDPVSLVGAGAGIAHPPIVRVPLDSRGTGGTETQRDEEPLNIAEAKTRLARTLGVDPANIRITVEA